MENTMKAILIGVYAQEVIEVVHDGTLQNIYDLLVCRTFDVVRIDDVNSIFVDDEGILKDNLYFEYSASDRVLQLAGNGLILGVDDEGNSISPTLTVEDVKGKVNFLPEGFKVEPYARLTAWD